MDATHPFWNSRRVFLAGGESAFGVMIAEQLHQQQAEVTSQIRQLKETESPIQNSDLHEKISIVRGLASDRVAVGATLSAMEAEVVFLCADFSPLTVHTIISAARKTIPNAAIVVLVSEVSSRVVAVAEAFRVAGGNPVGVVCVPESQRDLAACEFMIAHAERVIRREPAAMRGVATVSTFLRIAA